MPPRSIAEVVVAARRNPWKERLMLIATSLVLVVVQLGL